MDDEHLNALAKKCQRHYDSGLWTELIVQIEGTVKAVVSGFDDSDDLLQTALVKIGRKIKAWNPQKGNFSNWVKVVARRIAINEYRKRKRREEIHARFAELEEIMKAAIDTASDELAERIIMLNEGLARLNERCRDLITLRWFEFKSWDQIGEKMSTSPNAARMRENRCIEELGSFLKA